MEEGKRGQGPEETSSREANKVLEAVLHGGDAKELVYEMRGSGVENT